jgi:hypothetical protein
MFSVESQSRVSAVTSEARELVEQSRPDVVVFGHSHKAGCERHNRVLYVNPGSAGPARCWKLGSRPPSGSLAVMVLLFYPDYEICTANRFRNLLIRVLVRVGFG